MTPVLLLLSALGWCALAQKSLDVLRSDNVTAKFNDHYYAEWYIVDDGSGNQKLRVVLKLTNFDYSSWTTTDGSYGHWLGIGFGSS